MSDSSKLQGLKKGRKRNNRGRRKIKQEIPFYSGPVMDCCVCGKPIKDMSSAITEKERGLPAHFDCIIKKLAEQVPLREHEKIVYTGSGKFAVIHSENNQNKNFSVVQEIDYEKQEEEPPEWRGRMRREIL